MTIEEFALKHNLRTKADSCGEALVILGKPPRRPEDCSHIFYFGDGTFGLTLLLASGLLWNNAKKRLLGLGFEVHQDGESDGVLTFDPGNPAHVKAALKAAGILARKNVRPETRLARSENMRRVRQHQLEIFV